jgi:hypothetical protein
MENLFMITKDNVPLMNSTHSHPLDTKPLKVELSQQRSKTSLISHFGNKTKGDFFFFCKRDDLIVKLILFGKAKMSNRILIALDFSTQSRDALDFILNFAVAGRDELILLTIVETYKKDGLNLLKGF